MRHTIAQALEAAGVLSIAAGFVLLLGPAVLPVCVGVALIAYAQWLEV